MGFVDSVAGLAAGIAYVWPARTADSVAEFAVAQAVGMVGLAVGLAGTFVELAVGFAVVAERVGIVAVEQAARAEQVAVVRASAYAPAKSRDLDSGVVRMPNPC